MQLHAPLDANVNDKGCAFGGSLAGVMTLAGWGLLTLKLEEAGLEGEVYVADSQLRYLKPLYADLQAEARLPEKSGIPLFGIVSRMDEQKGIDLAIEGLRLVRDRDWQAVILGTGHPEIEAAAISLAEQNPDRVRVWIDFNADLGRRIYAGVDAFLIPSRYEPCGLTQMISMRYGTVPVARAVGVIAGFGSG